MAETARSRKNAHTGSHTKPGVDQKTGVDPRAGVRAITGGGSDTGDGEHAGTARAEGCATEGTEDSGALVRRAVRGDEEAWRRLVNRHGPAVWNLIRARTDSRADAEDVYQATWLLLAENLERLRDPDAVLAWLVTTARRESGRARRSRQHESPVGHFGVDFDRAQSEDPQQALLHKLANSRLGAAFARLQPSCQRLLRVLAVTPEASYAQISDSLGIPHGTIGPKKSRCLTYLRQQLALVEQQTGEAA